MLTKKDFKAVAEIIANYIDPACVCSEELCFDCQQTERIALDLARYFATQNPRFDRERFMKACGLGDGK